MYLIFLVIVRLLRYHRPKVKGGNCFVCRLKSRWFRIQFEELCTKLTGADRYKKEADLKSAMKKSSKSVAAVMSLMYSSIEGITTDKLYGSMNDFIEEACFSDKNLKDIDHHDHAKQLFASMFFFSNKVLRSNTAFI